MKKKELANAISKKTSLGEAEILEIIELACEEITEALKNGEEVKLFGFGKFVTRPYGERKCYNPITGEIITLSPSVQPAFMPGPKLREEINKK